jgi:hypothetical protein
MREQGLRTGLQNDFCTCVRDCARDDRFVEAFNRVTGAHFGGADRDVASAPKGDSGSDVRGRRGAGSGALHRVRLCSRLRTVLHAKQRRPLERFTSGLTKLAGPSRGGEQYERGTEKKNSVDEAASSFDSLISTTMYVSI